MLSGRPSWLVIVLSIAGVAVAAVLYGVPDIIGGEGKIVLLVVPFFGLFGAFLGTIMAFDSQTENGAQDRPLVRTILSGIIGAGFVAYLEWSADTEMAWYVSIISICGFGFLGWLGWKWAQYVDF